MQGHKKRGREIESVRHGGYGRRKQRKRDRGWTKETAVQTQSQKYRNNIKTTKINFI